MVGPLLGMLVGLCAIQEDPVIMLIGFFLSARYILFNSAKILPYVIILPVFFADWLYALGYIPYSFTWLPDVGMVIFTIKVIINRLIDRKVVTTRIDLPLAVFFFWAFLSLFINGGSPLQMFFSLRQMFKYVVMFYLFIHINFEEPFLKKLNLLLLGLFFIQVPTALVKMTIYGRTEWAIGTYAEFGGGLSAILPLFVNAICLGFYFYESQKWQYLGFMAYFQLFYYACPKRVYPLFAIASVGFLLTQAGKENVKKVLPLTPLVFVILVGALYVNPDWNQLFTNPKGAVEWAKAYEYQKDENLTTGRTAVAELVVTTLAKNPVHFVFGFGPGTLTESFNKDKTSIHDSLGIYYGITEFVILSLEYGFGGLVLFLWLMLTLFRVNQHIFNRVGDGYWRAISFGFKGILFICTLSLFYTPIFRLDVSGFMYWYIFTVLYTIGRQRGLFAPGNAHALAV